MTPRHLWAATLAAVVAAAPARAADLGLTLTAAPQVLVPVGRLADTLSTGWGASLLTGARFELDDFEVVPELALAVGLFEEQTEQDRDRRWMMFPSAGMRLSLDKGVVVLSAHLRVGYALLTAQESGQVTDGLCIDSGGAVRFPVGAGLWLGVAASQAHVFTDPGVSDQRWVATGLELGLDL